MSGDATSSKKTGRRRLYLMRHGHVDYFDPDITEHRLVNLTEEGRAQAAAAGNALRSVSIDIAAHSTLPRTMETLEIVLKSRTDGEIAVTPLPGLEELTGGIVEAKSREELAAWLAFSFDDADQPGASFLPGGETFASARTRIVEQLEQFVFSGNWRSALIVAHEGVNRIILDWACGGNLATIGAFEQDLGCINVLDIDVTPAPDSAGVRVERALIKSLNVTPYDIVKDGLPLTSLEHLFGIDFGRTRPDTRPTAP